MYNYLKIKVVLKNDVHVMCSLFRTFPYLGKYGNYHRGISVEYFLIGWFVNYVKEKD